jgi:hypothetical protein
MAMLYHAHLLKFGEWNTRYIQLLTRLDLTLEEVILVDKTLEQMQKEIQL